MKTTRNHRLVRDDDDDGDDDVALLLVHRCLLNLKLGHYMYWYLRVCVYLSIV